MDSEPVENGVDLPRGILRRLRRLLLLGAILAQGESMTFGIQSKAALKNGELTPEQLREVLIFLVHYVGYPRAAGMLGVVEKTIQEAER